LHPPAGGLADLHCIDNVTMKQFNNVNKLIFASNNQGKIKEMTEMLKDLGIEVLSAKEAGFSEEVEEDRNTFAEMSGEEKNNLSNRGWAFKELRQYLENKV